MADPVSVLDPEAQDDKGENARLSSFIGAIAIADLVKSTLGPKGMDKMLVSPDGEVLITNDGATIVDKMQIEHPVAKLMAELSKSQDDEIGDGTRSRPLVYLPSFALTSSQWTT